LAFAPYGKNWRVKRKMAQQYLKPDRISRYESIQMKRASELVENLSKTPDAFLHHVRTLVRSLSVLYSNTYRQKGQVQGASCQLPTTTKLLPVETPTLT
jgi:cytochrome P450